MVSHNSAKKSFEAKIREKKKSLPSLTKYAK